MTIRTNMVFFTHRLYYNKHKQSYITLHTEFVMTLVSVSIKPDDQRKIREMTELDGLNLSAFVRAKVRERYSEFQNRRTKP